MKTSIKLMVLAGLLISGGCAAQHDTEVSYLTPFPPDGSVLRSQTMANTQAAIAYCLAHPQWRLSVQTHKYLGIP